VVTGHKAINAGTDCFYDPRALVTQHDRQRSGNALASNVGIGLAHAGRYQPDEHLVSTRLVKFERFVE
jgi:hypothetical protein